MVGPSRCSCAQRWAEMEVMPHQDIPAMSESHLGVFQLLLWDLAAQSAFPDEPENGISEFGNVLAVGCRERRDARPSSLPAVPLLEAGAFWVRQASS